MLDRLNDRLEHVLRLRFQQFRRLDPIWQLIIAVLLIAWVLYLDWQLSIIGCVIVALVTVAMAAWNICVVRVMPSNPVRTYVVMGILSSAAWAALAVCGVLINADARLTQENIRRVRVGMTRGEVETLLGPALQADSTIPRELELTFTRPKVWPLRHPMLWIHLRDGRVCEVYGKIYYWYDDLGVYGLSRDRSWERQEFQELFPR